MGVWDSPRGAVPCQAAEATRTKLARLTCHGSGACSIWVAHSTLQAWAPWSKDRTFPAYKGGKP